MGHRDPRPVLGAPHCASSSTERGWASSPPWTSRDPGLDVLPRQRDSTMTDAAFYTQKENRTPSSISDWRPDARSHH